MLLKDKRMYIRRNYEKMQLLKVLVNQQELQAEHNPINEIKIDAG